MAGLEDIWNALSDNLVGIGKGVVGSIPGLVQAAVILVIGWVVAWVVSWVVKNGWEKLELNQYLVEKTGFKKVVGTLQVSHLLALIAKWYTLILFLGPAAAALPQTLNRLAGFFRLVEAWVPMVIGALLVGLVGLLGAEYVSARLAETKAKHAPLIGSVIKVVIWVFTALTVLSQVGVEVDLASNAVLIVLAGIMLAISIGFGLALKDHAGVWIKDVKKNW